MWRLRGEALFSCQPTSAEPVKVSTATSGWSFQVPTISAGWPVTRLYQPGGSPASASVSASRPAVSGVRSDGLCTTAQPAASAGATLCSTRFSGKLNGVIAATTPNGWGNGEPERHHAVDLVELHRLRRQPPGLLPRYPQRGHGPGHLDPRGRDRFAGLRPDLLGEVLRPLGDQPAGLQQQVGPGGGRPSGQHRRLGRRSPPRRPARGWRPRPSRPGSGRRGRARRRCPHRRPSDRRGTASGHAWGSPVGWGWRRDAAEDRRR